MLPGLRTYRVLSSARQPLLTFILTALIERGCRVIYASPSNIAPFVITFETPDGERIGIVVYAFLATRTPTKNRPKDERSFQIKYGSKPENNLHVLWTDCHGLFTTLLVGIDPKQGFFVAADPAMHSPTKFFIRLEFKDRHADEILANGWAVWERDRHGSSGLDEPVEVLVGVTKKSFLDYVRFERAAAGLSVGDRHLLGDKQLAAIDIPELLKDSNRSDGDSLPHRLLTEFSLDGDQILEVIAQNRRLKMAVRGWVAEEHLRRYLVSIPGVSNCEGVKSEGGPDLELNYLDGPKLKIECKNVLRKPDKDNNPRIDFQRTRASKADPCSRYYAAKDFDLLAGCLHAITEDWSFRFQLTRSLPPHQKCFGKITNNLRVTDAWLSDPREAFRRCYELPKEKQPG
jgi:hypothetical protein